MQMFVRESSYAKVGTYDIKYVPQKYVRKNSYANVRLQKYVRQKYVCQKYVCRGRWLISDPLNSKRRGTDAIRAEALLIDFSERAEKIDFSLRKSTFSLFKLSLILLQSAIPRTLAKNANRDILPVCNRGRWSQMSLRDFPV